MRKIIHVDMDAFFASVEIRDNPRLAGLPLVIGGDPRERGVVSTASYEARKYGIHSAMPARRAGELCPGAVFMRPNIAKYVEESHAILEIFRRYTPTVEQASIDEAYLDVTENYLGNPSATLIAMAIRRAIFEERGLTASAGVSFNKFLAKMASEKRKPDGLSVITPAAAPAFLAALPIDKFHGIGEVTARKFLNMGVKTGADLLQLDRTILTANFGKAGDFYYHIVRGEDDRPVVTEYERKSVGREITFQQDLADMSQIRAETVLLAEKVSARLAENQLAGRTVTLKLRYENFQTVTRALTGENRIYRAADIAQAALALLEKTMLPGRKVRLLGVTASNFAEDETPKSLPPVQLEFSFDPPPENF